MKFPRIQFLTAQRFVRDKRVILNLYNEATEEYVSYVLSADEARKMLDGLTKVVEESNG